MQILQDGEIILYGFVGDNYWDEGFTAREVVDALAEIGRDTDVTVRINSGGGYVDDGIAIFNALTAHKGAVRVEIDAVAASAASIIAMAGRERVMRAGAMIMIHDPALITIGTAADHEKSASLLDKMAALLAGIYADASGETTEAIRKDMREEIWLDPAEAVERGYATAIGDRSAKASAAFDYRIYDHAPERLVALSRQNDWSLKGARTRAAAAAASTRQKENDMTTEKKEAAGQAADIAKAKAEAANETRARIKAIVTSPEAAGQPEQADYFAYETEMTAEDAVKALARARKAEPASPAPEPDPEKQRAEQATAYEAERMEAAGQAAPAPKPTAKAVDPAANMRRLLDRRTA